MEKLTCAQAKQLARRTCHLTDRSKSNPAQATGQDCSHRSTWMGASAILPEYAYYRFLLRNLLSVSFVIPR
ncbi:hypothetical protein SAMN04488128_1086 [Chitinophaga eiseniae]|uniref:Uncharacterized protein n=1 Tax=Chitinophaga eiseniae TaxID=634771 RepID=A0A1T4U1T3_9BACT|nr:hypothetical protein SAMN04488128_1086 [Chitinophaga eiseniae]